MVAFGGKRAVFSLRPLKIEDEKRPSAIFGTNEVRGGDFERPESVFSVCLAFLTVEVRASSEIGTTVALSLLLAIKQSPTRGIYLMISL
jgi:hypothetical protein